MASGKENPRATRTEVLTKVGTNVKSAKSSLRGYHLLLRVRRKTNSDLQKSTKSGSRDEPWEELAAVAVSERPFSVRVARCSHK